MDLPCTADGKAWTLSQLLEGVATLPAGHSSAGHSSAGHSSAGHGSSSVRRLVSLTGARAAGDLCFFSDAKLFSQLLPLPCDVLCLISRKHARLARARGVKAALVEVEDAKEAWRLMAEKLLPDVGEHEHAVHPSAIVAAGAILHDPVSVGAYSVIEDGVEIGAGTSIASHCVVRTGTRIGKRCYIGAGTIVANACLEDGVVIHEHCAIGGKEFGVVRDAKGIPRSFPQLGRVSIGAYSEIFKCTTIGRGALEDTILGTHVKIGCHSMVSHNCLVGDYTILSPRCGLAGSVRVGRYVTAGASLQAAHGVVIGDRVGIGGKCALWPHITIGDGVRIMNDTVVERDLKGSGVTFFGRPPRPLREELHRRKKMDRLLGSPLSNMP